MQKNLYLTIIALFSLSFCFGQSGQSGRDTARKTYEDEDKTFTKTPVMPQFQNGWAALEDSLKLELHKQYKHFEQATIIIQMIVSKTGEVSDVRLVQATPADSRMTDPLIEALKKTSGSWVAARTGLEPNMYPVKCYKMISITFEKKDLMVKNLR